MLAAVQSLRLGWLGYYQFRRVGWGWWGYYQFGPSAGLGSGLGGGRKAAMLAAVQSLRQVVTTSPDLRLGSGLGGVQKAAMLAAVQSLRLVGYYQSGGAAGLYNSGAVRRELMAEVAA
jgi:hypothetical protein